MNDRLWPIGAASTDIPRSAVAAARTTEQLVLPDDADADYFRQLERAGIRLNENQLLAVRHGDGPLLTLAGAGSGKTSVLVCRAGYLTAVRRVDPRRLLLLTFSAKAAKEMRERIVRLPGMTERDAAGVQARTFHSFFLRLLRQNGDEREILGDVGRQHVRLKTIMREEGLADSYPPEVLLSLLSHCKMNKIDPDELPEGTAEERDIKRLLFRYERWKREQGLIDFDDVLPEAYRLLTSNPGLLGHLRSRFHYVMIDEFQDTNPLQYELVRMLAEPRRNLMAVGDDDQTIYSFNGARSEFILDFEKTYPGAKIVTLDVNYRSPAPVVGLGNEIIRFNKARRKKTLKAAERSGEERRETEAKPRYLRPRTTDDEASAVADRIEREVRENRRSYGDFAVLFRSSAGGRAIVEQLLARGIPHVDYGDAQLLYEHGAVKPVLGYLRLALNRRDFEAMEAVLPSMYLNRDRAMAFIRMREAAQPKRGPLVHLLSLPELKEFQAEKIRQRLEFIRSLRALKPDEAIAGIRRSFYDSYLDANDKRNPTPHKEHLAEWLDELETSAARFGTIAEFIGYVGELLERRRPDALERIRERGDRVALMTIHRSKGLEFPFVFLIGASEGSLPHASALEADRMKELRPRGSEASRAMQALEEERRLAYVAVTRAREELVVSSPSLCRGKKAAVSRFLLEAFGGPANGGNATDRTPERGAAAGREAGHRQAYAENGRGVRRTETVSAWLCSSPSCNVWSRISSKREADLPSKACPICGSPMVKGGKTVPV